MNNPGCNAFHYLKRSSGLVDKEIKASHSEGNPAEEKNEFGIGGGERERSAGRAELKTETDKRYRNKQEEGCRKSLVEKGDIFSGLLKYHNVSYGIGNSKV